MTLHRQSVLAPTQLHGADSLKSCLSCFFAAASSWCRPETCCWVLASCRRTRSGTGLMSPWHADLLVVPWQAPLADANVAQAAAPLARALLCGCAVLTETVV